MKKVLLSVTALLLVGLAYLSESPLLKQESMTEMTEFYNESTRLQHLSTDSVNRFIVKVRGFTMANPKAEYDPLYPKITKNIRRTKQGVLLYESY